MNTNMHTFIHTVRSKDTELQEKTMQTIEVLLGADPRFLGTKDTHTYLSVHTYVRTNMMHIQEKTMQTTVVLLVLIRLTFWVCKICTYTYTHACIHTYWRVLRSPA